MTGRLYLLLPLPPPASPSPLDLDLDVDQRGNIAGVLASTLSGTDLELAESQWKSLLDFLDNDAGGDWHSTLAMGLCFNWFCQGHWQKARDHCFTLDENQGAVCFLGLMWGQRLLFETYLGREQAARQMLDEGSDLIPSQPGILSTGEWHTVAAAVESLWLLGSKNEAAQFYPMTVALLETGTKTTHLGQRLFATIAGIAASAAGLWAEAEAHFEEALRQAQTIPIPAEVPEVKRFHAQMLISRSEPGDLDRARLMQDQAIEAYRDLGMVKHAELAEEIQSTASA